jgi:hypothetical protein
VGYSPVTSHKTPLLTVNNPEVWESEEWLQQNVKPLAQSGGMYPDFLLLSAIST